MNKILCRAFHSANATSRNLLLLGREAMTNLKVKVKLCPTLCDPMDCSPRNFPGKSTGVGCHFLLQPRQHIKKQRHYFANKGPSSQSYVFPIIMYGYENWAIKKAERQRIDAFELWCWRRLLRVPLTVRRYNQSILKETIPGCSLEGLMLKLKFHYFGYLMRRTDSLEKTLMLGKIKGRGEGDDRGSDGWMESLT